jgi:hypothetical protein
MDWARILAFVTGMVDQELLARIGYLAAENRIPKAQLKGRLKLSDAERATLGEIGHRLGRKVLGEVANVARPDTILAWYRKLVARKFDGSKACFSILCSCDWGSSESRRRAVITTQAATACRRAEAGQRNGPRGACHRARIIAPQPCIR